MASTPIRRKFLRDLKEAGGWPALFERVAQGERLGAIAQSFGISRTFLHTCVTLEGVRAGLTEARRLAAEHHMEEAGRVIEEAPVDRDSLTKAKMSSEHHVRLASLLDRETYGEKPVAPVINLNIEQLHLDALRTQRTEIEARELTALPAPPPSTEPTP